MNSNTAQREGGVWMAGTAVVAAIASSACCWLPLSLLALGISGGAVAAAFQKWRPVFLPVAFLLLGAAFWVTYKKPKPVSPEEAGTSSPGGALCCSVPPPGARAGNCCPPENGRGFTLKRLNRGMLWVATVVVLAFAFFPSYVDALLGGSGAEAENGTGTQEIVLGIDGMTCDGCAVTLEKALGKVPGVERAIVSYEDQRAVVTVDSVTAGSQKTLVEAVEDAGYKARLANSR